MKRVSVVLAVVVSVLGLWAGVAAWRSPEVLTNIQAGLAVLVAGNLIFCLWLWSRAKPDSGDATVLPGIVLVLASVLVGILPSLLWPAAKRVQLIGSIVSVVAVTLMFLLQIRNRRRLRRT